MIKLSILVPQYKETEEIVRPLLDSINLQRGIDFKEIEVIIVNDGSNVYLSDEFLNGYKFITKYVKNTENCGVSATRNKALDLATGEYVMFCDADDAFYNSCALNIIFGEMMKGEFDTLSNRFVEEQYFKEIYEYRYLVKDFDTTYVHGKVHRRQYLIDNNIRWNEKLRVHEDSYFNCLCWNLTENRRLVETPFYMWQYRSDSVCRTEKTFILKTYCDYIESVDCGVDEYIKRDKLDIATDYVNQLIYDTFFFLNIDEWNNEDAKKFTEKIENRLAKFLMKHRQLFDVMPEITKNNVIRDSIKRVQAQGFIMQHFLFDEWFEKMEKLGYGE